MVEHAATMAGENDTRISRPVGAQLYRLSAALVSFD
jgi:hypothetical protein